MRYGSTLEKERYWIWAGRRPRTRAERDRLPSFLGYWNLHNFTRCHGCGTMFLRKGNYLYCTEECLREARLQRNREGRRPQAIP